jgi:hypothetical protein
VLNGEKVSLSTITRDYNGTQGMAAFGAGFVTQGVSAFEQGTIALGKAALVNGSFSAASQALTTGSIDPVKTLIDATPLPQPKSSNLINPANAQKAVTQATNSIKSSTSAVPERKVARLAAATNNLNPNSAHLPLLFF